MTVNNPIAQYCHSALEPAYAMTALTTPTVDMIPPDCAGVVISWNLVQTLNNDAPFDPALIKNTATNAFSVDTTNTSRFGQKDYTWVATAQTSAFIVGTFARNDFNIFVQGCTSTSIGPTLPSPGTSNYFINNVNQTFTLPSYTYSSSACANPYEISVVRTDTNTTVPFTWDANSS